MRKYWEYIKNSFKENLTYRVLYFTGILQTVLALVVQLYLWRALVSQAGGVTSSSGIITLGDMTTYVLIGTFIGTLISNNVIGDINNRVRGGQVATDLIKPMNFIVYMFCRMIGRNLFNLIFRLLPVLVIAVIFLDFQLPSLPNPILFLVMVINTLVIMFLIVFNLGLLSFWYMAMWQVDIFFGSLMELFSGRFLPLWFFPQILVSIAAFMPFRLMYYVPISIYLGKLEILDCWLAILQQFMWMAILGGITALTWRSAIKKLVIQGG